MFDSSHLTTPAQVLEYILGVRFPAEKIDLIEAARKNIPPAEVMNTLEALPEKTYEDLEDLSQEIKNIQY